MLNNMLLHGLNKDINALPENISAENIVEYISKTAGELNEDTYTTYVERIESLLRQKNIETAKALLNYVFDKNPTDGRVLYNKGVVAAMEQEVNTAIGFFKAAINAGYENFKSWSGLGFSHKSLGEGKTAIECLKQAANAEKKSELPKFLVLYEMFLHGFYEEAIAYNARLLVRFPDNYGLIQVELTALYELKQFDRLSARMEQLEHKYAAEELFIYDKAKLMINLGNSKEALEYLNQNNNYLDSESLNYCEIYGAIYSKLQMTEEAKSIFEIMYKKHESEEGALSLAMLLMVEKKTDEAIKILADVIKWRNKTKEFYTALFLHLNCLKLLNKDEKDIESAYKLALKIYADAYNEGEYRVLAVMFSAECYKELGQYENEKLCRKYVELANKMYQEAN